ncbi:MAG: transposase [Verrucomicrobia bacterium]|nr:transposase [Verrucomicrobiota bacterium]
MPPQSASGPLPHRQTARLLLGRISTPGATYFLTLCTALRAPVLLYPETLTALRAALSATFTETDPLRAACVMPDHLHLIFTLGPRLSVGQIMGKFKTLSLRHAGAVWRWQLNGYEHRLRDNESEEDYAFYVYMNPYRAGLAPISGVWPAWICPEPNRYRFLAALKLDGTPPCEWLDEPDRVAIPAPFGSHP